MALALLPVALAQSRRDRRMGRHPSERSPIDMLRGSFAATWVEAIDAALEESHGKPVELGDDLFPLKFPSEGFEGWSSWHDYLVYQFGQDLNDRSVAGLTDAFALRMGEVIRSHGRHEITREIVIRWNNVHYIAERNTPRAA